MDLNGYSVDDLLLKRRSLRRKLLQRADLHAVRIAVLSGSTANEITELWEVLLLAQGFRPEFLQTEYGRYHTDATRSPEEIIAFRPDLVYVHTCIRNLERLPPTHCNEQILEEYVSAETDRFREIWHSMFERIGCQVIQNNFELPAIALLGNLDAVHPGGRTRFVNEMNVRFAREACAQPKLILQDLCGIAARIGLERWNDELRWHSYKLGNSAEGSVALAKSLTAIVAAIYGRTKKCLVLDLDNTIWGGVIGDVGPDKIVIGRETPVAEAYLAFQKYCIELGDRGVVLAACSKNNEAVARQGFDHPDSLLKAEHFSALRINWEPKDQNIRELARELNLGLESFVFVDDNPAERAIVAQQVPEVAVPDVGEEVARFAHIMDAQRYFEPISIGREDLARAQLYQENTQRAALQSQFANYGEFLDSLAMSAEIDTFRPVYIDRIAQLTNKTNQFNLTTRRYTLPEMEAMITDPLHLGLYGRLKDKFGDNGLVSVVLGRLLGQELHLELWLMSCRVLKRDMEVAMLDVLVQRAAARGLKKLIGYYKPTKKNAMVADHYGDLGFENISKESESGNSVWQLDVETYRPRNSHIKVTEMSNE